ncbi:MAG: 50S ribosomal protein L10 [Elusimicrobia bacterium]|nr:50S ribosomal protein L10 [Elusimicrobiota bacterium]
MKLTREQKKTVSKELAKTLKDSGSVFFTQYQGLKFVELEQLRKTLKPMKARYRIVRNTTLSHALKEAGISGAAADLLKGPGAILFAPGDDPVSPAKALVKFAKEAEALKLRGGYVGGQWMTPEECKALASIGTKPELLGKLANALYSSVAQGAWVLAAPIRDLVLALKAVEEKQKKSAGAAA